FSIVQIEHLALGAADFHTRQTDFPENKIHTQPLDYNTETGLLQPVLQMPFRDQRAEAEDDPHQYYQCQYPFHEAHSVLFFWGLQRLHARLTYCLQGLTSFTR